ncbi:hypothetical protein [Sphingobacterium hungaricum]|uniref:Uncharacterized protein n=1 Tax=Sphingobacterium hungaricum TaxID=2082723 RepID=A0A928UX40_9SPHI|nr:hypothetical protein [Sphingobacterium hungaricum]MBE8714901.1 hypothetical protein [Sphingobacterium hungaricum]
MKILFLFINCVSTYFVAAQSLDLKAIRQDFNQGHKNENLCKKHLSSLEKNAKSPVEKGYAAAYHMFMARHTANPIKKMSYFKNGKNMLEKQIDANPNDVELRFIRLCIQYYIPDYLGYNSDVSNDKKFVMNNLYKLKDESTKDLIYNYLKGAKMYSTDELALLGR